MSLPVRNFVGVHGHLGMPNEYLDQGTDGTLAQS